MADKLPEYAGKAFADWASRRGIETAQQGPYMHRYAELFRYSQDIGQKEVPAAETAITLLDMERERIRQANLAEFYSVKLTLEPMKVDTV